MKRKKTIRSSIRKGSMLILCGGLFLAVFFTGCLIFLAVCQQASVHYSESLSAASEAIIESDQLHREIDSLVYSNSSSSTINLSTPSFDKLCSMAAKDVGDIGSEIETAKKLYSEYKSIANNVLQTNAIDKLKAQDMIGEQLEGALEELTAVLHDITTSYTSMTRKAGNIVDTSITISIICGGVFLVLQLFYSFRISNRMAREIATPIVTVAEWADDLSMGADHIEASSMPHVDMEEIQRMVKAFETMADSIKGNVDVVRKVADGDMTAYVNIRSSRDSLGKSLYKMVQSNDLMFAQISQIADSVTEGTDSIAAAASLLADSCTTQANAIAEFQRDIKSTNQLVKENAEDAAHAHALSDTIQREVVVSKEKMQELVEAMKAIYKASEKVSGVIANIESLANQTNLLAINATIEAKRAGEAGKSFAVVASSVKDLADKSAISATQTKALIDDTIAKAKRGSQLSDETYSTFEMIMDSLEQIIAVSSKIAETGAQQHKNMVDIAIQIDEISRDVSTNAATSEETAAMTSEISKNAEVLKASMGQFNLRNRQPGKPYIPPEKANDKEFIRVATENYNKFINSAAGKKLAQEMNLTDL